MKNAVSHYKEGRFKGASRFLGLSPSGSRLELELVEQVDSKIEMVWRHSSWC